MQSTVLNRDPRVDMEVCLSCGVSSCVFMFATSRSRKVVSFSRSFAKAAIASEFDAPRSCCRLLKASRSPGSRNSSITRNSMSAPSSKNSTSRVLKRWSRNVVRDVHPSLLKTNVASLLRPRCVHRICWGSRLSAGRCPNSESSWYQKKSSSPSASRRSVEFFAIRRYHYNAPKPGKSATTQSYDLKKSNSSVRKPAGSQRSNHRLRRVRPSGNPTSRRPFMADPLQIAPYSRHLSSLPRRKTLAGVLRRTRQRIVGIPARQEAFARIPRCLEANAETIPSLRTDSLDPRQLFSAQEERSGKVVQRQQCAFDLDTDQCLMVKPNRMSLYRCKRVRHTKHKLQEPCRARKSTETLRSVPQ